jgi:hypothetical protein
MGTRMLKRRELETTPPPPLPPKRIDLKAIAAPQCGSRLNKPKPNVLPGFR